MNAAIAIVTIWCTGIQTKVPMDVFAGDKAIGSAALTQSIKPDGTKVVNIRMELSAAGKTTVVRQESRYDPKGAPVRSLQEILSPTGKRVSMRVATFDADGASIVREEGPRREVKQAKLGASLPRENPSEFWFLRDKPEQGARVTFYRLDPDRAEWFQDTVSYEGLKPITIGGEQRSLHHLKYIKGEAWLDDGGEPWMIIFGEIKMLRKAKPGGTSSSGRAGGMTDE